MSLPEQQTEPGAGDRDNLDEAQHQFTANWDEIEAVEPSFANAFISQVGSLATSGRPDGLYLGLGHVSPPYPTGSTEEVRQRRLEERGGELPVHIFAHLFLTRDRAEELVALLVESITELDAADGEPS